MADIVLKKGDRLPVVKATLKDVNGAVDLTGTTVKFIMRNGGVVKINAAAVIESAVAGTVKYEWALADVDTAGQFRAEFEVTDGTGKKLTFPNDRYLSVEILEDIA